MWWFFTNVSLIVLRDWKKALFYHPQPCSEKLRNKARQETKLLQFLRTKWVPCDKGPSSRLLQTKDSGHRLTYFFICCFWVISVSRLFFWNNICNNNKNKFEQDWKFRSHSVLWRWEGLVKNTYADIRTFLVPNCYFCILMNMQGRLVDLVHVIKSVRLPNNSNCNIIISYKCVNL